MFLRVWEPHPSPAEAEGARSAAAGWSGGVGKSAPCVCLGATGGWSFRLLHSRYAFENLEDRGTKLENYGGFGSSFNLVSGRYNNWQPVTIRFRPELLPPLVLPSTNALSLSQSTSWIRTFERPDKVVRIYLGVKGRKEKLAVSFKLTEPGR